MGKFSFYVFLGVLAFHILAAALISCSDNEGKSESIISESAKSEETVLNPDSDLNTKQELLGCYRMIIAKDTALLEITSLSGNDIAGKLVYNRFEKDDNSGEFAGKLDSGRIVAFYRFSSEGIVSVKQVVFKSDPKGFFEGYGDMEVTGDTAVFKYPHALQYETGHTYEKITCN